MTETNTVHIDKGLKNITVPKTLKNLSEADRVYPRGSILPLEVKNTLRFFLWWKAEIDLDLSAVIFDKDFNVVESCSFIDLKTEYMVHSGDVRSAPNGGAEFVDIDLSKVKGKYLVLSVISYTGEPFSISNAFVGFMNRKEPNSGEKFEPATVQNKFNLKGEGKLAVPIVFDLEEQKVFITDFYFKRVTNSSVNNPKIREDFINIIKVSQEMSKAYTSQYSLFNLFAKANGLEKVDSYEEADISFGEKGDIKPWELDKIVSTFLES